MNKFRRITLAGLAGGVGALFGGRAFAHGHGRWGSGHDFNERIERMVKHLAVEVDATPEQQQKLTAIAKSAAKDLEPLRGQAMETRKQALELLSAPNIDRAAIEKLRAEMRQAAADLEFEKAAALRDKARELEQLELQMR